jgi:tetratricopeptide (TPR) repeat protein
MAVPHQKLLARAITHHQAGRTREADAACGELLARWPNDVDALNLRAVIACMNGRFADGKVLLERLLARRPDDIQALTTLGDTLDALGDRAGTIATFARALKLAPRDASLHSRLGTALLEAGRCEEAETAYRQSIQLAGRVARTQFNHGVALQRLGQIAEAIIAYRNTIALDRNYVAAHLNLGNLLMDLNKVDDAITCYRTAIALQPRAPEGHCNLGLALYRNKQLDEAAACLIAALACDQHYAEAHAALGAVRHDEGDALEAVRLCEQAIRLKTDLAGAYMTLGAAYLDLQRDTGAVAAYEKAIELTPNDACLHSNLGAALVRVDRIDDGVTACQRAIALDPLYASAYTNLGVALLRQDKAIEAIAANERAIALDPTFAKAYSNLSECLKDEGRLDEALQASRMSVAQALHSPMQDFNHALALLMEGDWAAGWAAYEVRRKAGVLAPHERKFTVPEWRGEPLTGRTLLLHAEQGLGDTLQFVRFVRELAQPGVTIVIESQRPLVALLQSLGSVRVVPQGAPLPPFDFHLPLMSLPNVLGTRLDSIPAAVPYLIANAAKVAGWKSRFGHTRDLNVGVVWSGNPDHKSDRRRSIPAASVLPALTMPGVRLFSLQKDPRPEDRGTLHALANCVTDLAPELEDFTDTAAALSALDQVIAVDTSVAHLAGALGRPVWVMLPYALDWRWLRDREDSPWYPTMRLFRQSVPKDWTDVLARLRPELSERARQKQDGAIF